MPEIPASKPAPGMVATSGPMGDDPFGSEHHEEETKAPAPTPAPAQPSVTANDESGLADPAQSKPVSAAK